jgi:hypothetical protein
MVDEYYYQHQQQHQVMLSNDNDQYVELGVQQDDQQHQQQHQHHQQQQHDEDATPTIIEMHRKLLYVLSHPELFAEAAEWQTKVDMGIDPSRPSSSTDDDYTYLTSSKSSLLNNDVMVEENQETAMYDKTQQSTKITINNAKVVMMVVEVMGMILSLGVLVGGGGKE